MISQRSPRTCARAQAPSASRSREAGGHVGSDVVFECLAIQLAVSGERRDDWSEYSAEI
jgi:hypothetical protein